MKVLYAILNYKRFDKQMIKSLNKISNEDVIICTDDETRWKKRQCISIEDTVAKSKNKILKYALEKEYDFCFIIEDDVLIKDKTIFFEYINLMEKFDLNFVMYGFHNNYNKVLNERINPCMLISMKNRGSICINRFPCSALIGFRIFEDMTYFDERLKAMEHEFWLEDLKVQGNYPFTGFIFDTYNSWEKIKKIPFERVKNITQKDIIEAKKTRNVESVSLQSDGDSVINYIVEKMKG